MRYLYIMVLMAYGVCVSAQVDTSAMSHIVDPITITINPHPDHTQLYKLDESSQTELVNDLLESQSTVYIKSYGGGSLATLSLRGGNASQTQLQWEGIPINNPMLGLSDLSLVALGIFDQVRLVKGGQSAQYGSGAMTGMLNVRNRSTIDGLQAAAQITAGSYGELGTQLKVSGGNKKVGFSAKGFLQQAENDFTYQLTNGDNRINSNAEYESQGLVLDAQFHPADNQGLSLSSWFQNTHRNIPPTTVQNSSSAFQDDILSRHQLRYYGHFNKINLHSQAAYFNEQNNYTDPDRLTIAENRFVTFYHSGGLKTFNNGCNFWYEYSHTKGQSKSYADDGNDFRRLALVAEIHYNFKPLQFDFTLRKEWNNIVDAPLIQNLIVSYTKNKFITGLKLSREFRSPTLNELYWQPVGNLELLPELGWNQELSFAIKDHDKLPDFNLTTYHRKIDNWILWIPEDSAGGLWAPTNLTSVRSYGADIDINHTIKVREGIAEIASGYAYTKSINLSNVNQQGIKEGDQLIYTPLHKTYATFSLEFNKWAWNYAQQYTSGVTAINENLDGYTTANTSISYDFNTKNIKHNFQFNINNIFNSQYRIIERRPMPGRNFNIGWTIKFIKKNEK